MLSTGFLILFPLAAVAAGQVVTPPAIHLPYGAKVQTEINFSDKDVLGLVRELLPAAGELISMAVSMGGPAAMAHGAKMPVSPEALAKLDLKPLVEALQGITNFRFVAARFKPGLQGAEALAQFDGGAAKTGAFNRIVTDFSTGPGVLAFYAQAGGSGYLIYHYDAKNGTIRAARLSGSVDYAKLMKWIGDTMKLFAVVPSPSPTSDPAPDAAPQAAPTDGAK